MKISYFCCFILFLSLKNYASEYTLHETVIKDPFYWLEDSNSEKTKNWVTEESTRASKFLNALPLKEHLRSRLEKLNNYKKIKNISFFGPWLTYELNEGNLDQFKIYKKSKNHDKDLLLFDPNLLSKDSTVILKEYDLRDKNDILGIGYSKGGSDWISYELLDLKENKGILKIKKLKDIVKWAKVSNLEWYKNGFFYSAYDAPKESNTYDAKNTNHKLFYHYLNTNQSEDILIYENKERPFEFVRFSISSDNKYGFLYLTDRSKGMLGNTLYYVELGKIKDIKSHFKPIQPEQTNFSYQVIDTIPSGFIISTNENAPNKKLILFKPENSDTKIVDLVKESNYAISDITISCNQIVVHRLEDVLSKLHVYNLDGSYSHEIELPFPGILDKITGKKEKNEIYYELSSFIYPSTIYKYDCKAKKSSIFFESKIENYNPEDYESVRVFYPSKDSTMIPMFITYKKGLKLDGNNPTLLYGYGGFNINVLPKFNPLLIPLLEQGVIYASACLRGGSEYGENWHQQGIKLKKQNVFDDFISAAEYLIKNAYTNKDKLAITGRSNGGLLVGAVTNQRPDLFKVAVPEVGVMDMLKYHKFTIGWNWVSDYGSSENKEDFANLLSYSPIHNIKENSNYPAILITTSDHDDRVVPAHSYKYMATLKEKLKEENLKNVFIRIDTNSGHATVNNTKNIDKTADVYSFILHYLK